MQIHFFLDWEDDDEMMIKLLRRLFRRDTHAGQTEIKQRGSEEIFDSVSWKHRTGI